VFIAPSGTSPRTRPPGRSDLPRRRWSVPLPRVRSRPATLP